MSNKMCECCKDVEAKVRIGNFHLCWACHEVAKKDIKKIKEIVRLRQEKKIDKILKELQKA